jgi:acyl-CoA synthetase (AMP-forming)/AMP-acid ligase II
MNLAIAFAGCAEKHAQKTAIFYGEREISYAELHAQSLKRSPRICKMKLGVKPGDRVALWLKNCPEFVVCVLAFCKRARSSCPSTIFSSPPR